MNLHFMKSEKFLMLLKTINKINFPIITAILPNLKGNLKLVIIRQPNSILNLSKLSNS